MSEHQLALRVSGYGHVVEEIEAGFFRDFVDGIGYSIFEYIGVVWLGIPINDDEAEDEE